MARVQTGCADCTRCTNSAANEGARKAGRFAAAVMTAGLSEAGRAFTRNCRGCGHPMSLHGRADNARYDHQANPAAGAGWGAAAAAPEPAAPAPDVVGQLRQLGELRDAGILTPAEFESKKAELLGRL